MHTYSRVARHERSQSKLEKSRPLGSFTHSRAQGTRKRRQRHHSIKQEVKSQGSWTIWSEYFRRHLTLVLSTPGSSCKPTLNHRRSDKVLCRHLSEESYELVGPSLRQGKLYNDQEYQTDRANNTLPSIQVIHTYRFASPHHFNKRTAIKSTNWSDCIEYII